ncbi:hypothetical protein D3I60_14310 [Brevibacterium permense]|uniref:hypothetical protein n=1 Tax=Brevibacterium permense TaxID=234834 RepID=UPI0021CEAC4A|nr:hypothetical protein [Brevibacterium permense]MCU4298228.1 hypothetical protein [Brevibacterium permense]
MKHTVRNRTAAIGIAAVAGLAGLGLATGPAMAAETSTQSAASDVDTQSVYHPTDPVKYADELVRAWGKGDTDRVEAFASTKVAEELQSHSDDEVTHWDRVGGEGAAGTTYVDYENTVTGEKMSLGLPTEAVSNPDNEWGTPNAVHRISFED